jgi:hypothetical protein
MFMASNSFFCSTGVKGGSYSESFIYNHPAADRGMIDPGGEAAKRFTKRFNGD